MTAMGFSLSAEVHCTAFNNCLPLLPDCPFQINLPDWDGFGVGIPVPAYWPAPFLRFPCPHLLRRLGDNSGYVLVLLVSEL